MMNIEQFIKKRPYLYHLTDERNLPSIVRIGKILSTKTIIEADPSQPADFLGRRRPNHEVITFKGNTFHIRDQRPISEIVLGRSLTNGWRVSDFLRHLNSRVFLWPSIGRLERHFKRYEQENPIILRFNTSDIFANEKVELSRLNSGATRCSSHWDGNAPERGPGTFQTAEEYAGKVATVAEVTIPESCKLPEIFWTARHPTGPWRIKK